MERPYGSVGVPPGRRQVSEQHLERLDHGTTNLADILERVLDKGIVIAGDITISLAEVQLLTIKVRLLIASVDKAQEIGINWWQSDTSLSSRANELEEENRLLRERLDRLESRLATPAAEHVLNNTRHEDVSEQSGEPTRR